MLRGGSAVARLGAIQGVEPAPFTCAINVEEVWRGARAREVEAIRGLLGALRIAPLGESEGELAGSWRRDFLAQGITLSQGDCLVAAAAVGIGARLATGNPRHFPMPELEVEHWPAGD